MRRSNRIQCFLHTEIYAINESVLLQLILHPRHSKTFPYDHIVCVCLQNIAPQYVHHNYHISIAKPGFERLDTHNRVIPAVGHRLECGSNWGTASGRVAGIGSGLGKREGRKVMEELAEVVCSGCEASEGLRA